MADPFGDPVVSSFNTHVSEGAHWERALAFNTEHLIYRVKVSRAMFIRARPGALAQFEKALSEALLLLLPEGVEVERPPEDDVIDTTCVEEIPDAEVVEAPQLGLTSGDVQQPH